jgi:hypothetical protein
MTYVPVVSINPCMHGSNQPGEMLTDRGTISPGAYSIDIQARQMARIPPDRRLSLCLIVLITSSAQPLACRY